MTNRAADTWESADPYERFMGRWSRLVAARFVGWLDLPANLRWLDVGCGTGALSEAVLAHMRPAALTAVDPSARFLETVSGRLGPRVTTLVASADQLPLETASVDVAVSGLVLNFTDDPVAAVAEQARVVGSGTVAAYVWDYAAGMQFLRLFWDVATALDAAAHEWDEGVRFPLCHPDALTAALERAGLTDIVVAPIDIDTRFDGFDDLWHPFLGGQGPAPTYVASLGQGARDALRDRLRDHLPPVGDGSLQLHARAWAVRGHA